MKTIAERRCSPLLILATLCALLPCAAPAQEAYRIFVSDEK